MQTAAFRRSIDEWESTIGSQVRELRHRADLTQEELAHRGDLSVSAVKSLEAGGGSSLSTLIKALRALDRSDWLESIVVDATASISPMDMLRDQKTTAKQVRQRVRHRRG